MSFRCKGLLIILSSPSGAGKTSLAQSLLQADPKLRPSISVTTRPKRLGEVEGRDYYFVDDTTFKRHIERFDFLEYACVFGYWYGSLRCTVEENQSMGLDTLFDIDWQGAQQICQTASNNIVRIFVLPPTLNALSERLHKRRQDNADVILNRMQHAVEEISHWKEYDYIVVNNVFPNAVEQVRAIITAERSRRIHQVGLEQFVKELYVQKTGTH